MSRAMVCNLSTSFGQQASALAAGLVVIAASLGLSADLVKAQDAAGETGDILAMESWSEPNPDSLTSNLATPVPPILIAAPSHSPNPESTLRSPDSLSSTQPSAPPLPIAPTESQPAFSTQSSDLQPLAQLLTPLPAEPSNEGAPRLQTQPSRPEEKPFQPQLVKPEQRVRFAPGVTLFTPSAYGKSWGSGSVGVAFQSRTRFSNNPDGALGVGFGFGNARNAVGLDVGLSLLDLSEFDRGALSLKLHRLLPADFAIAVGVSNIILGSDKSDGVDVTPYGVLTKRIRLSDRETFNQLFLSFGVGSGNFRSEADVINESGAAGVFGSVAVRMLEQLSLITEWSGQDLSLGISWLPFRNLPLVITPIVTDITGNAGNGARFVLGIGYGFRY